jgi:hypothetical protein
MNEPTNPSDPKPNSDTPPPPPPPFTPPPSAETSPSPPPPPTPAPAPAAVPPRPPVYTPPAGGPPKKSATPWIIGGCGCLTLIAIVIAIVCLLVYRAKKEVAEFQRDPKARLEQLKEEQRRALNQPGPSTAPRSTNTPSARSEATAAPKSSSGGTTTYVNVKEKLPASLQANFVAFSFEYP